MRQGNLLPSLNKKEEAAGSGGKSVPRRGGGGNRRELVRKQEASQRALEREQHLMAARERGLVEAWHDKFAHMSDTQLLRRCRDELFVFDSYHFPPSCSQPSLTVRLGDGLGCDNQEFGCDEDTGTLQLQSSKRQTLPMNAERQVVPSAVPMFDVTWSCETRVQEREKWFLLLCPMFDVTWSCCTRVS